MDGLISMTLYWLITLNKTVNSGDALPVSSDLWDHNMDMPNHEGGDCAYIYVRGNYIVGLGKLSTDDCQTAQN